MMRAELAALGVLLLIQVAQGVWAAAVIGRVTGAKWLLGSRENPPDYSRGLAGRLDRARSNGFEALIMFTPVVMLAVLSGQSSAFTAWAAWVFVAARVVYIGCYAADLVPWRSVVWFVGLFALLAMIAAAFLGA